MLFNNFVLVKNYLNMLNFSNDFFFAEYTPENPKISTKCSHHYHLSCIYEWQERSEKCPVCGKARVFVSFTFCCLSYSGALLVCNIVFAA